MDVMKFFSRLSLIVLLCALMQSGGDVRGDDNVGIGTDVPDSSAILDIVAVNKGLLIPRLSTKERDSIVLPAKSLMIFNSTLNRFEFNQGTAKFPVWTGINSEVAWNINGNANISAMQFIGTTDSNALIFKTNALERMRILANGNVGIAQPNPESQLDVAGDLSLSSRNGNASSLRLLSPIGTSYSSLRVGAQSASIQYTLPLQTPLNGQWLRSDSAGNMYWKSSLELPSVSNVLNSTLVWNGSTWVSNPSLTINNNVVTIGTSSLPGVLNLFDGDSNFVSIRVQNLIANRVYYVPEVGDSASFVMTKGDQIIGGSKSFSRTISLVGGAELRWYEPTSFGNNYIAFKAPALASDLNFTWPSSDGTVGQVLSTNGSGQLSWQNLQSGVTGAGLPGHLAYWTSSTSIGTASSLGLDTINNFLGVGTLTPASRLTVNNGNLSLSNTTNSASELRWYEPSAGGNNYIAFRAPTLASDLTFTFPNVLGNSGQFLSTDGSGNLQWQNALTGTTGWTLNGNSGTSASTQFIGTTDNQPLVIRTNNTEVMRFGTNGNIGIGTNAPSQKLTVEGSFGLLESGTSPTYHTIFKASDQASDVSYNLPALQGVTGSVLSNDGSGSLSWSTLGTLGALTGSGSNGTLALWNGTTSLNNSTLLSYNTSSNFMGIGTGSASSRLEVSNGNIAVTNTSNTPGELRLFESALAGNNYTSFRAQSQANTISYTLPATSGQPTQFLSWNSGDTLSWNSVTSLAWGLHGNAGTSANSPALNFIGTTDNQSLAFRSNNIERIRLRSDGGLVIGNNTTLSNSYGKIQINDNSTNNNYAALGVISSGIVTGTNTVTMAIQASKQTASTTNIGGYFIASAGSNNYGVVVGNGGDVYLGQVDSLTPPALRNSILSNGNPNRSYIHHLNLSGELVSSQQSGGFGAGAAGTMLISQGAGSAPQWASPSQVLGGTVWVLGGNAQNAEQTLGTTTNVAVPVVTNGIERMRVTQDGRLGIGTNAPSSSAITDIYASDKGILIPRMTSSQRDAISAPAQGLMVYVSTAQEEGFWYYNGTRWMTISGTLTASSATSVRRKTSDQNIASTTLLQDDADMGSTLAANQIYEVEGMAEFTSLSSDPDASFGFTLPSGGALNISYTASDGSASAFNAGVNGGTTASALQVGASQISVVHFRGIVETGSSSLDFRFRWAQNTNSVNALTLKKNSYLKCTRIQ